MPRPTIPEIVPLIEAYRKLHSYGGPLHIILDDPNHDDHHVEFCLQSAKESGESESVVLAEAMLKMSKTQRRKIYRKF